MRTRIRGGKMNTHAMRRLKMQPLPTRMKPTRTSLRVRARRMSLSYFSYTTGTKRRNRDRNIPVTLTKIANPERPAVESQYGLELWQQ